MTILSRGFDTWRRLGRPGLGWLGVVVLLALPSCSLNESGLCPTCGPNVSAGPAPQSTVIFCDVEKERHCATSDDHAVGMPLDHAAIALATGEAPTTVGLDYSSAALAACGGKPQAVVFQGPFPTGASVCVNCLSVIPSTFANPNAVCVAKCEDDAVPQVNPPNPATVTYCTSSNNGRPVAQVSTNWTQNSMPIASCPTSPSPYVNACSNGGALNSGFVDPRRNPEPVTWTDLIGSMAGGGALNNDLNSTSGTTLGCGTGTFSAGAAAANQPITTGDAYIEFSALENDKSHVIGPSTATGPDNDVTLSDIKFGISLDCDGMYYIIENGTRSPGPGVNGAWGTYSPGDRFRITLQQHDDTTADVDYGRVVGTCNAGAPCNVPVFYSSVPGAAQYPLRVDT